ncbi:MAG TPA: endonuclease/exonuclease/phosphatase family protein [Kiritimatiellia bacterium]|nr:endonuclease/exonuclease/phosphatase family protein [Kiritimatiellia bacterium]
MSTARRIMRWPQRCFFPIFAALWLLGWILGDAPPPWLWLFFIPAPAVAVIGLFDVVFRIKRAGRFRAALIVAFTLLALGKTLFVDARWNRPAPVPQDALRVIHWNVAHTLFGFRPLLQALAEDEPDLVILVEARFSADLESLAQRELGLHHIFHDQGMAVLSRHPFAPQGTIPLANGRAWWAVVDTPDGPLHVATLDILSHPLIDRHTPVRTLADWIAARTNDAPLLLVGDFNTPRDATALDPLRAHLRHAYETVGRGWPYTWPLPFPLYAIDHAWASPDLAVHTYTLRSSPLSDHRRQVLDVSIGKRDTSPPE